MKMRPKQPKPSTSKLLRRRAEHALALRPLTVAGEGPEPLLRELQVYQVELEMQSEALREAECRALALRAKYEDLFQLAPLPYLVLDAHSRMLEWNRAASELFGLSHHCNDASNKLSSFIEPRFAERLHLHIRATLAGDGLEHCDLDVFAADRSLRSVRLQSQRMRDQPSVWRTVLIERFESQPCSCG